MKLSLKLLPEGLVDIKDLVHVYGKERFNTIRQYSLLKLSDGSLSLQFYDKRGQLVKPKQYPKIGRKSNMSQVLKDIVNG
jgi:hypothetical protein